MNFLKSERFIECFAWLIVTFAYETKHHGGRDRFVDSEQFVLHGFVVLRIRLGKSLSLFSSAG